MEIRDLNIIIFLFFVNAALVAQSAVNPCLTFTPKDVQLMRQNLRKLPLLDQAFANAKQETATAMAAGIVVPVPKDPGGGYTHEQHKRNYLAMQQAGALYQLTKYEKYAIYVRDMLMAYAALYPTLPLHPVEASYARGKLFWQQLNEAVWLVYAAQAYDCIYNWLSPNDRKKLETQLFRPYADFLSLETPQVFNRVHNHGVWAVAAVGMIGLAMHDDTLINRALYGVITSEAKMQPAGFLEDINQLFSPAGYYTEGPYYQRYAMTPFLMFAQALAHQRPDVKIFAYRNSLLIKAVEALLQLTDTQGRFFPFSDAIKEMSFLAPEVIQAVNIAYYFGNKNPELLHIAKKQGQVTLTASGLAVAKAIEEGKTKPFVWRSVELHDGADGSQGAIGILRHGSPDNQQIVTMRYTSHGLSHGHYDKLGICFYDNGNEILQDYGAARFVNVEHKEGGRYLPENDTWAMQTIAHNTVTIDEKSQFEGNYEQASTYHSEPYFFDAQNPDFQIMSAYERHAYAGVDMQRTTALLADSAWEQPILIDLFRISSNEKHQYDLVYHYLGQVMRANFNYHANKATHKKLGESVGYEHLWLEASGKSANSLAQFTWLKGDRFYTLSTVADTSMEFLFTRLGANDPNFNLRNDPAFIIRAQQQNQLFVSVLEPHGSLDTQTEQVQGAFSQLEDLQILHDSKDYTVIQFKKKTASRKGLLLLANHSTADESHELDVNGKLYKWTGYYQFVSNY